MNLDLPLNLLRFGLVLGGMIFIHELGHFLVAKWRGIYVFCFSLGFGPKLLGFRRGETEYRLSLIPLGGYVRMAGQEDLPGKETEGKEIPPERNYLHKKTWEKVAVIAAGPLMNILGAFLIFSVLYLAGFRVPSYSLSSRIGWVEDSSPASAAGIRPGDKVAAIDGEPVSGWEDVSMAVLLSAGRPLDLEFVSGESSRAVRAVPASIPGSRYPVLGIQPYAEAVVEEILPGLPAGPAGILPGDWIRTLDGEEVSLRMLVERVSALPGGVAVLGIERGGKFLEISVPVGTRGAIPGAVIYAGRIYPEKVSEERWVAGDLIVSIDGEALLPERVAQAIESAPGRELRLEISREKDGEAAEIYQDSVAVRPRGMLGVKLGVRQVRDAAPFPEAFIRGAEETFKQGRLWVVSMILLIRGDISHREIGGPIMIYLATEEVARHGLAELLQFVARICVIIGLVNLLPLPILDGGNIAIAVFEGIRRRRLSEKTLAAIQYVGLTILAGLFLLIFYNDIVYRLLGLE